MLYNRIEVFLTDFAHRPAAALLFSLVFGLFCPSAYSELSLNGSAIYKDLGKQQFVAGLFVDTIQDSASTIQLEDSPKRMEVRMLNNYSKRRWLNLWMQSISINNDRESFSGSAQEVIDIMQAPKSAPQKGDIIEYIYHPTEGTSMRFNGTELVANYPKNVFNILLRTWIGPIPPSTTFKEQLLGLETAEEAGEAEGLLSSIQPTSSRVALAASWIEVPVIVEAAPEPEAEIIATVAASPTPEVDADSLPAEPSDESTELASTSEPTAEEQAVKEAAEEEIEFNVAEALAQRDYTPLVVAQIYKSIAYPNRAVQKNQQGTVRIGLVVDRSGELLSVTATQESDYRLLNQAALKAVRKAAPFPNLPEGIKADSFELNLPITFRLQ